MFLYRLLLLAMWGHFWKVRTFYPVPTTVGLFGGSDWVLRLRLDLGFVQSQAQGHGTVRCTELQKVLTRIDKQGGVRHDTQARQRAGRQHSRKSTDWSAAKRRAAPLQQHYEWSRSVMNCPRGCLTPNPTDTTIHLIQIFCSCKKTHTHIKYESTCVNGSAQLCEADTWR